MFNQTPVPVQVYPHKIKPRVLSGFQRVMTTAQMIKENENLKAANEASKEAAKNIYKREAVEQIIMDYWETTKKRAGFDKAAAIYGFTKPSEMFAYLTFENVHPTLVEVDEDGNKQFVLHGERYVEDETKWIKDKKGKDIHPYKKDRKGVFLKENCTNPIKRWTAEKYFELFLQDMYLKAKDAVTDNLANAKAIAESQGVSIEGLIDQVAEGCVKKQQAINEKNVEQTKAAKKNAKAKK